MSAKKWLENHKTFSHYDLEDYDEGGYIGINEDNLHEIMEEYANNSEILGAIISHIFKMRQSDDQHCLQNSVSLNDYVRGRHAAYKEIIDVIGRYKGHEVKS